MSELHPLRKTERPDCLGLHSESDIDEIVLNVDNPSTTTLIPYRWAGAEWSPQDSVDTPSPRFLGRFKLLRADAV